MIVASSTPPAAPIAATSALSVSSCRTMRGARGAEAETDGDLAVPRAGAREQQVREVRARDEQDDARRREQHPERMLVRLAQHRDAGVAWRGFERERLVAGRAGGRIRRR